MLTLVISPEIESRLTAQARARGLGLDAYATQVLEQAALFVEPSAQERNCDPIEAFLDAMARGSESLPVIATSHFTRESFYSDRG